MPLQLNVLDCWAHPHSLPVTALYLLANNKRYSNYIAAFRRWLRNDNFRKTEDAPVEKEEIIIACPNGHGQRKTRKGVMAVCPECRESLRPVEEMHLERAIV